MSIWNNIPLPHFEQLEKDISVNTVVIGGGIAGLLTAYLLQEKGIDCIVIEAAAICSGQTQNTTAKITSQHGLIYSRIAKNYGEDYARQYAQINEKAIEAYQRIIDELDIDCDFKLTDAVLYSQNDVEEICEEYRAARAAGIDCRLSEESELPLTVLNSLVFPNQAQFHPLKFLSRVAETLTIYENTPALKIVDGTVHTPKATIKAANIVVATHFPFVNFPGEFFLKMSQERSYVTALTADGIGLNAMHIGTGEDTLSFRQHGGFLLLGGNAHRTGTAPKESAYQKLEETAKALFPSSKVSQQWAAQDCITPDGIPYIGTFTEDNPHIFVATGFNKWGMTSAMVSAMLLTDRISGIENDAAEVFSPRRFKLRACATEMLKNAGETVKGFADYLVPATATDKDVRCGEAKEIVWNGKTAGAYRDADGKLYLVSLECPHLKCRLQWNASDKSWDCPCHGSRYGYKGNLLDNPAQQESILLDIL